jgi:hypothetical protein
MPAKYPIEQIGMILAESYFSSDERVAQRWGVSRQTLTRYRRQMATDPLLSRIVALKVKKLSDQWAEDLSRTIKITLNQMSDLIPRMTVEECEILAALSNCLKVTGELSLTAAALLEPGTSSENLSEED